ncbi:MAG: caspase family protein [Actinomycetota bacterium]|nr:caspase family protein [Actinomycetota bacterium]
MRRLLLLVPVLLFGVLAGTASANPAPAGGDRWALIVGVDHFEGATRPNFGALADASNFRQALLRAGWADDHIKVLTDGSARQADIRSGLQWLVDHSSPTSLSVMHYSGHVKQVGSTEYLWPHDNRFIADTELASSVRQLRGQAWIDISGCEAAGFDEGISAPNRLFTASSRSTEKSYEYPDLRQSVFSSLLIDRGMLQGQADTDGDHRVSVQEAFAYAAARAPQITSAQRQGPQHPVLAGGDGTPLFLDAVAASPSSGPGPAPASRTASNKTCILFLCF